MPVDFDYVPIERAPLVGQRFERHQVLGKTVDLDVVAVHDGYQVMQTFLAGQHDSFPTLAFVEFAVAHQANSAPRLAVQARGQSHARGLRQAESQRTAASFDAQPRGMIVGMSLERGVELAQVEDERGARTKTALGERGVKRRTDVRVGQHQPVAVRPVRTFGIDVQNIKIQSGEDVSHAQRTGRVA